MGVEVRQKSITRIETRLDDALEFTFYSNSKEEAEQIALDVLNQASSEGWLNGQERIIACDYIMDIYGLDMQ